MGLDFASSIVEQFGVGLHQFVEFGAGNKSFLKNAMTPLGHAFPRLEIALSIREIPMQSGLRVVYEFVDLAFFYVDAGSIVGAIILQKDQRDVSHCQVRKEGQKENT